MTETFKCFSDVPDPPDLLAQVSKENARLREENERLRKTIGKCVWQCDEEFLFSPCYKGELPIPQDEWIYCPWCGAEIVMEESGDE
jgi:hypothetical protein